jgi:hypothetical protein
MKTKQILKQQFDLIYRTDRCLNYLLDFIPEIERIGSQPSELAFLYHVLRDYVVIQLYKLLNSKKEHYSFQSLINDPNIEVDKIELKRKLSFVFKKYKELGIERIRVKHVGHLDYDRKQENLDWKKVKELLDECKKFHDLINSQLFDTTTYWELDTNPLNMLYKNTNTIYKLYNLTLPRKRNEKDLDIETFIQVLKN